MATASSTVRLPPPLGFSAGRRLSRWWLDRSVLGKGLLVLAVPMVAFVAVTGAGLALQIQERNERQIAIAANALALGSLTVLADATDGETGVRGYAGTADPLFLAPYTAALAHLQKDVDALLAAGTTDTERAQAAGVAATTAEEFSRLAEVRASTADGASGVSLTPALEAGKLVMDRLRVQVATLVDEPLKLVAQKRDDISRLEASIEVVQIVGLVAGVVAALAGIALFTTGISRRVRIAADNAKQLGEGERLEPTAPASDELGQLNESLVKAQQLLAVRLSELSAVRDQAVAATEAKNTFLSRTSHELRTPLNAIIGFAQLLEMSVLGEDDQDSTVHILRAGEHLLALINELIDTSRIESGELKLSVEPVRVHGVIAEVATLIGPLAAARGITVTSGCPDAAVAVLADHQRLRQVLVNLASNAVKYNRHGGSITIGYGLGTDNQVEMTVSDTGPGLTSEEVTRIFVPFERLAAEQHGIEGTGIGLPLSLALTQAMHGSLDVSSTPGSGSTFTVRLPRAPDIDPGEAGVARAARVERARADRGVDSTAARQPIVVLSIEDNLANSLLLARFFDGRPDTTLLSATTARSGIELAHQHVPDLILLDLHLPDMSGEEVFVQLRAEAATATVPIVILSADASPGTIRRLLARGARAYLTKPLDLAEIDSVLNDTAFRKMLVAQGSRTADRPSRTESAGELVAGHDVGSAV